MAAAASFSYKIGGSGLIFLQNWWRQGFGNITGGCSYMVWILAVTEPINEPVGIIRAGFLAVGLFLGRKSKISHEQNVKEFQFYIRMPNFRLLGSIIKKKYPKVADPLKLATQYR